MQKVKSVHGCTWGFPRIGVPLNHPFYFVSLVNHPFGGTTILGNLHYGSKACTNGEQQTSWKILVHGPMDVHPYMVW